MLLRSFTVSTLSYEMQRLLLIWVLMNVVYSGQEFLINTRKCKVPDFPAFTEQTKQIYEDLPYVKCGELDTLTYTLVENDVAYLHFNTTSLDQYYKSEAEIDCCFSYIYRSGSLKEPDVGISITDCEPFNSSKALDDETVMVKCYLGADLLYSNVHNPIVYTNEMKRKKTGNNLRTDTQPISVVFIVIDSISRLNLVRTMPRTRNFLLDNGFIEFIGYNKIDDNTFPNFNALITGLNEEQSNEICEPKKVGGLDKCPMIWYDFRDSGYVTAYAEDWTGISTYNYLKKGFQHPPTDYYFKPYMEAAEMLNGDVLDYMLHCTGPETEAERVLTLAKDFTKRFRDDASFGIFWMNTFSHNYINAPTRMDDKTKIFFEDLKSNGIFNKSIVFLLSDHGIRYGSIRRTIQGWYEERLPTNLISVPPWFQEKYPEKYQNLKNNSKKLTSTYDVYMTLQEILNLSVKNHNISRSIACPSCDSLFSNIPENRSCKQAGIPEVWCTCLGRFDETHPGITDDLKEEAMKIISLKIGNENQWMDQVITKVILSSLNEGNEKKSYFLTVVETNTLATYQALFRVTGEPVKIEKLVKVIRIY